MATLVKSKSKSPNQRGKRPPKVLNDSDDDNDDIYDPSEEDEDSEDNNKKQKQNKKSPGRKRRLSKRKDEDDSEDEDDDQSDDDDDDESDSESSGSEEDDDDDEDDDESSSSSDYDDDDSSDEDYVEGGKKSVAKKKTPPPKQTRQKKTPQKKKKKTATGKNAPRRRLRYKCDFEDDLDEDDKVEDSEDDLNDLDEESQDEDEREEDEDDEEEEEEEEDMEESDYSDDGDGQKNRYPRLKPVIHFEYPTYERNSSRLYLENFKAVMACPYHYLVRKRVIEKVLSFRGEDDDINQEIFVKWSGLSYRRCEWIKRYAVEDKTDKLRISRAVNQLHIDPPAYDGSNEDDLPFDPDCRNPERVVFSAEVPVPAALKDIYKGSTMTLYLVKWCTLPYTHCTWESREDIGDDELIEDYVKRLASPVIPQSSHKKRITREWKLIDFPDDFFNGMKLRPYQVEGVNWLVKSWMEGRNCILADEMGLGKTAQTMATLYWMNQKENISGPFLVLAPLATLAQWKRESDTWTSFNSVLYHGTHVDREIIRKLEFYPTNGSSRKSGGPVLFHVLITSYEVLLADLQYLRKIHWSCVAIDEAHRLKNNNSKTLGAVKQLAYDHIILLTGTPFQNETSELWSLLHLIDPRAYPSFDAFQREYCETNDAETVRRIQNLLKPILLRRLKGDVEKSIAAKEETIVQVELTVLQKQYYRAIYDHNIGFLRKGVKHSSAPSLMNVMMELRKCCNHPYLIKGAEESCNRGLETRDEQIEQLVRASGKMVFVDKLLPKLKASGHKVLIFSQMVRVLDILEDYVIHREYKYERIDGGVRGVDRQAAIDRFCKPDSDAFVFLLCTRAGGLGINLQVADTVIIFDSDWNPQNDLQAQARCHRIGQKKDVKVYRLITRGTYESDMFRKASMKLGLDRAILSSDSMSAESDFGPKSLSSKQIDTLLRYGAYGLLEENDDAAQKFVEADIDQILERSTVLKQDFGSNNSTFSKATFTADESTELDVNDPNFWDKVLPDVKESEELYMEPRERKAVQRYETHWGDSDSDESDDSEEENEGSRTKNEWGIVEKRRFRVALAAFGWGQWERIKSVARLNSYSLEEIESFARAYLAKCLAFVPTKDKLNKYVKAITGLDLSVNKDWMEDKVPMHSSLLIPPTSVSNPESNTTKSDNELTDKPVDNSKEPPSKPADDTKDQPSKPADDEPLSKPADATKEPLSKPEDDSKGLKSSSLSPAPETPSVRVFDDSEEFQHPKWKEFIDRNWLKTLNKLTILNFFRLLVEKGHLLEGIPLMPDLPATWWTIQHDRDLIIGCLKHGFSNYDAMRVDPDLSFHLLFPEEDEIVEEEDSKNNQNGNEMKDDTEKENEGEEKMKEETSEMVDNTKDITDKKEGETNKSDEMKDVSEGEGEEKTKGSTEEEQDGKKKRKDNSDHSIAKDGEWPAQKALTRRIQRLYKYITGYQRNKKHTYYFEMRSENSNTWFKRERQELMRAVMQYGLPTEPDVQYPMTLETLKEKAGLKKKTVESLKEFLAVLVKRCRDIDSGEVAESDKTTDPENKANFMQSDIFDDFKYTTCNRFVQRIDLIDSLRQHFIRLSPENREAVAKRLHRVATFPKWWDRKIHEPALVYGVLKHGFGKWDDIILDPELPFYSVYEDAKKNGGTQMTQSKVGETNDQSSGKKSTSTTPELTENDKMEGVKSKDEAEMQDDKPSTTVDEVSLTPPLASTPATEEGKKEPSPSELIGMPRDILLQHRLEAVATAAEVEDEEIQRYSKKRSRKSKKNSDSDTENKKDKEKKHHHKKEHKHKDKKHHKKKDKHHKSKSHDKGESKDDGKMSDGEKSTSRKRPKMTPEEKAAKAQQKALEREAKKAEKARLKELEREKKKQEKELKKLEREKRKRETPEEKAERLKKRREARRQRQEAEREAIERALGISGLLSENVKLAKGSRNSLPNTNDDEDFETLHSYGASAKRRRVSDSFVGPDVGSCDNDDPLDNVPMDVPPVPIHLGGLVVVSLGTVNTTKPKEVSLKEPPIGYRCTRLYQSFVDPTKQCLYTCRVDGEGDVTQYSIIPADCPSQRLKSFALPALLIELHTAIDCAKAAFMKSGVSPEQMNVLSSEEQILNGSDFFGFSHPVVKRALHALVHNAYIRGHSRNPFPIASAPAFNNLGLFQNSLYSLPLYPLQSQFLMPRLLTSPFIGLQQNQQQQQQHPQLQQQQPQILANNPSLIPTILNPGHVPATLAQQPMVMPFSVDPTASMATPATNNLPVLLSAITQQNH